MAIRKSFVSLVGTTILVMSIWLLGSLAQAAAETMTGKAFNHVTKMEVFPVGDVEGHVFAVVVREGVTVFQPGGGWAWHKSIVINDLVKGAGTSDQYLTTTFLDGSTITTHTKGTLEVAPGGVPPAAKFTGDIVAGTGRFQGIKGTQTISVRLLPPEKGELGGKALGEGTMVYTLPGK
jgi:hypothetical protein